MSKADLKLAWCGHAAAKYACEKWHYSRSLPTPPRFHVGVWENAAFVGAIVFSRGANKNLGTPWRLSVLEVAELTRVALSAHRAAVSRMVAVAVRLLCDHCPGLRLLVSFADPHCGHHGGIYQACGWLYLGQSSPAVYYQDASGKLWHPRMAHPTGWKRSYGHMQRVARPQHCRHVSRPGKHRYLYPLDEDMRRRLLPLAKPYPKRAAGVAGDTPAVQAGEGGSTPTAALSPDP